MTYSDYVDTTPAAERRGWFVVAGAALLAAVLYAFTLADYAFPGESAAAMCAWSGLDETPFPAHPVWGWVVSAVGKLPFPGQLALRFNMLSLLCAVASAAMLARLVRFHVLTTISHENAAAPAAFAADAAAAFSALVFITSVPVWQASTHLEHRIFDVALALATFLPYMAMARLPRRSWHFTIAIGALAGLAAAESSVSIALFPIHLVALAFTLGRLGRPRTAPLGLFISVAAAVWFLCAWRTAAAYASIASDATALSSFIRCLALRFAEMKLWFTRPGWLFVAVFSVLPFLASVFSARRAYGADRTWSMLVFELSLTICTILAIATPFSPMALMASSVKAGMAESLPVAVSTLAAFSVGCLIAYWYVLFAVKSGEADREDDALGPIAAPIGAAVGLLLAFVAVVSGVIGAFNCSRDRGRFADICAGSVIDGLGERTWLVSTGLLDDHLRILAASRGKELNIVSLQRDTDELYLQRLSSLVREKGLASSKSDLSSTLALGVLPFLQDWFAGDPDVCAKAVVFGVPDFWYLAGKHPVPENIFFGGTAELSGIDGRKAAEEFKKFWARVSKWLPRERGEDFFDCGDPVSRLRLNLRRHLGFVGNNLGVMLLDLGLEDEAYELFELVRKTIDTDNVSALFNEFEMARQGSRRATRHLVELEKELKAIADDPERRYSLWSLSRFYGYVRSPEIFARMGYDWAISGQTGAAIRQVKRAFEFVPKDRRGEMAGIMAAVYALGGEKEKSAEAYRSLLERNENDHEALSGLARLAMQSGNLEVAVDYLTRAAKAGSSEHASAIELAIASLFKGDLATARALLQRATDLNPSDLRAWGLLAHVMLQQSAGAGGAVASTKYLDELERVVLPRMQSLAGGPKDFYVQVTRALVYMHKGPSMRREARNALAAAWNLRPESLQVAEMLLPLDMQLDDRAAALEHARKTLRIHRQCQIANYVIGSIKLSEGDLDTAETFLRAATTEERPFAAALNDLAETLRRKKSWAECERFAAAAIAADPELYVAYETAATALLDQGKDPARAEELMNKALELAKKGGIDDIRILISAALAHARAGNILKARGELRVVQSRRKELLSGDAERLDAVAAEISKAGRK